MTQQEQVNAFYKKMKWEIFPFQTEAAECFLNGYSGIVNAPTGSGKTFSLLIPAMIQAASQSKKSGLKIIWITPIRALAKEILISCNKAIHTLALDWTAASRSGDTKASEKKKQLLKPPDILITTPETMHVLFSTKAYHGFFEGLTTIIVDEWHELIGSKRGVQMELAISRLRGMFPKMSTWGISATIGNMDEALEVLLGINNPTKQIIIKSKIKKKIAVKTIFPDELETLPWAGHIGIKLLEKVLPIIHSSKTSLIFCNTRAMTEIWYQQLLDADPSLAGIIAVHHGSISRELRDWVEQNLYTGTLKAVVCTSSLDLGVDFRPVETIIQVGSPKGVARFLQRAGRSGHQPDALSTIYFLPTHSLELIEAAALRNAVDRGLVENRIPFIRSFDVLLQYLMTLAVSEGFVPEVIYEEVKKTYCYNSMTQEEWFQLLNFLVYGAQSLEAYDEYAKVEVINGLYKVTDKRVAQRHKLSIGTIVSDAMLQVKFMSGRRIGVVEEWFVGQIKPGDHFWFAGRALEMVMIKDMTLYVRKSSRKSGKVPSYMGGRMPLSSQMSKVLREEIYKYDAHTKKNDELDFVRPMFELQKERSILPKEDELLIEYLESKEGFHLLIYPFEGRNVHEGMAALIAKRISRQLPISFSLAMNDYGFELLSEKQIDVENIINKSLFSDDQLIEDITQSMNAVEMSRRKFRDIARISGLVFAGFPGKMKKDRHLQSSSSLLYEVFKEYESDNLLFLQTAEEVRTFQLEEARMREALTRIKDQKLVITFPEKATPLAFPILVDSLSREKLSSEKIEDLVARMKIDLLK